ncbi:hypothetical protein CCP2SC5_740010 [Azospirillaceae bacterium]
MYIPSSIVTSKRPALRVLLQGSPGTGKTYSALTFPFPLIVDFDHKCPVGVPSLPFWDKDWCVAEAKRLGLPVIQNVVHKKELFQKWLEVEGPKFRSGQTLIFDSWTSLQDEVLRYFNDTKTWIKEKGEWDTRKMWADFLNYTVYIVVLIKQIPADIIVICHEQIERNEKGDPTGTYRALSPGSFGDRMAGSFTDYWRTVIKETKDAAGKPVSNYLWQITPTPQCGAIFSGSKQNLKYFQDDGRHILANYASLNNAATTV